MRSLTLLFILVLTCGAAWWSRRLPVTLDELATTDADVALTANRRVEESPWGAEPVLLQGLTSPSPRVRGLCAHHLGRLRLSGAIPGLQRLLRDPEPSVRVQAAIALRSLRGWTDVAAVRAVAADASQPPAVREPLMLALGRRHDDASCDFLLGVAGAPALDVHLRGAAVDALGQVGRGRDDVQAVLVRLARDPNGGLQLSQRAVMSLAVMRHGRSLAALASMVDDVSLRPRVRAQAALALGRLGDPRAAGFLGAVADDVWKPMAVRLYAVTSLADLGVAHPHPFVEQALRDRSTYVRGAAVRTIVRCHDADLIDALTEAAAHEPDSCVREQMVCGGGRLKAELEQEEP